MKLSVSVDDTQWRIAEHLSGHKGSSLVQVLLFDYLLKELSELPEQAMEELATEIGRNIISDFKRQVFS